MRLVRDNGLTIALLVLFLASIPGQWFAGWRVVNEDAARHDGSLMSLWAYACRITSFRAVDALSWSSAGAARCAG